MKYSIHKDSDVNKTVDKIKNILNNLGIETKEKLCSFPIESDKRPQSLGLNIFDNLHVSNGKGTSYENARASAHSEFMERLQNNFIKSLDYFMINFRYAPDEKRTNEINYEFYQKYYDKKFIDYVGKLEGFDELFYTIPFYSVKEKMVHNVPISFILTLQGSNGMCAGNTPEEALVQGLSEICERYSMRSVFMKSISLPDIPKEVWGKFDRIVEMKEYIEQYGYEVRIRDASLGQNLPVICTTFEHKKNGYFSFNFGAQPSLPVAIERTLTEFMQAGEPDFDLLHIKIDKKVSHIDRYFLCTSAAKSCVMIKENLDKKLYNQLFTDKPYYSFSKNAWIDEQKNFSNKDLLKFLINNVIPLSEKDIYIRDVSFLNFPAYYIYVPKMSEIYTRDLTRLKKEGSFVLWRGYEQDETLEHKDIDSLINALLFKINYPEILRINEHISPLPDEYILMLCYLIKQDIKNIIKFGKLVLKYYKEEKYYQKCKFICDYYSCMQKYKNDFRKHLEKDYDKIYINNFEKFIKDFSFEKLKKIISENNKERDKLIAQKENAQHNLKTEIELQKENILKDKLTTIKHNLSEKYIENTPNQMNLKEVFDFI